MDAGVRMLNRRTQVVLGTVVFLISLVVYSRTVAPTTSFWDCGEFIACSYTLSVMHPPGAPLYMLIGRLMTMLPFFEDIGLRVNIFSAFISAVTVLLTYLIIVQLIRRWRGEAKTGEDRLILYLSGVFGALAFAFTDSFWFNAVEAEVYALSMFFTALVVWLALTWGERSEERGRLSVIFLIFYLFGLAAGVHLLNVLVFPFLLFIAYFHENQTVKRLLTLIFVQGVVPFGLYIILFQYDPSRMSFEAAFAHQAKAWHFLKWFGFFWVLGSLVFIYFKDRRVFAVWWVIPVLAVLGYSTYLVIYIRAGLSPPINENAPSTLQAMMDYLSRKQYRIDSDLLTFFHRKANFWHYQIHMLYTRYLGWQFIGKGTTLDYRDRIVEIVSFRGLYGLPFVVGLWGAVHHFFKDWKRAAAVLALFFLTGYAIIVYLNQTDPQPRERDYVYVGSFFVFALWIGVGMAGIFEWISEALKNRTRLKKIVYGAVGVLLFVAVPLHLFAFNFESHDRRGNYIAYDYSYNILQSCEPDAILFANGDNDTFPLWFLQEVYGIRKDVRIVCLPLLNTPWYIRQLRDQEPRVPMFLSDQAIEHVRPIPWKKQRVEIPVPDEVYEAHTDGKSSKNVTFTLEPTYEFGGVSGLRVQDLMILRILEACQWRRPVYFAITVPTQNKLGLDGYLRMDGLAYRVMPYPVGSIDPGILRNRLLDRYAYRSLGDEKVHLSNETVKLLQNYRHAFLALVRYYLDQNQKAEAAFILDELFRIIPEDHVPYWDASGALLVSDGYSRVGRTEDYEKRLQHVVEGRQIGRRDRLWLGSYYAQVLQDWDRAEAIFRELIQENPDDVQAYVRLVQTYASSRQYDKGIILLENWLTRHPGDPNAQKELTRFKKLAAADTGGGDPLGHRLE